MKIKIQVEGNDITSYWNKIEALPKPVKEIYLRYCDEYVTGRVNERYYPGCVIIDIFKYVTLESKKYISDPAFNITSDSYKEFKELVNSLCECEEEELKMYWNLMVTGFNLVIRHLAY